MTEYSYYAHSTSSTSSNGSIRSYASSHPTYPYTQRHFSQTHSPSTSSTPTQSMSRHSHSSSGSIHGGSHRRPFASHVPSWPPPERYRPGYGFISPSSSSSSSSRSTRSTSTRASSSSSRTLTPSDSISQVDSRSARSIPSYSNSVSRSSHSHSHSHSPRTHQRYDRHITPIPRSPPVSYGYPSNGYGGTYAPQAQLRQPQAATNYKTGGIIILPRGRGRAPDVVFY